MKIKSKTMLGVSLFAMTFSFSATAQTCKPVPTCAELGYTETSCSGDSIKCPFDESKLYCVIVPYPCNSSKTKVGDIYYEGDMCADGVISGLTPIGVVCDVDHKLVISLEEGKRSWNDVSDANNKRIAVNAYTAQSTAEQDFNGIFNTEAIVAFATSSGQAHQAAQYCHDMTTGGKTWYLPSLGEMTEIRNNYSIVNASLSKISATIIKNKIYWTSTEYYTYDAWARTLNNSLVYNYNKNSSLDIRCVFAFNNANEGSLKSCPTGCNCSQDNQGKYTITSAKKGYTVSGSTCFANPCLEYPKTSMPAGCVSVDTCFTPAGARYKCNTCQSGYTVQSNGNCG